MLLVLIFVATIFEVVKLVFKRLVDVTLEKFEFVPLIVVVVILLDVIFVVLTFVDCILLDVKFIFHKFCVVTFVLSTVDVFIIKFSPVIDVMFPFVTFISVDTTDDDNKLDVVIFDKTADDPETFVNTKFVVVVLIALTCVVIKEDVVIFVVERLIVFILFVICNVEADMFDVSIFVFVIFVEIQLDVVKFVVFILDVIILDDVILVFTRLVTVEFV
jgi:hypothetical protein